MRRLFASSTVRGAGLAVGVGAVWVAALVLSAAVGVLALAFISILLAAALDPLVDWIRTRTPLPRGSVVALVYAVFVLIVVGLTLLVVPPALAEAETVLERLPGFLARVERWGETLEPAVAAESVGALVAAARNVLRIDAPEARVVIQAGLTLAEALASFGAVLALVFFWLVGHARFQRYVLAFVPPERRNGVREAWSEIELRLGRWLRGQLILMVVVGVLCGAAYLVLGVPAALLLGLVAGICEAIPMVGPIIGAIPALLFAAAVSPETVVGVLAVTVVIQLVENNVLVPVVMRNAIGLSPLIVTLSLLVGGAAGGIAGALVAVPLAAVIEVVLARLQDRDVPVLQASSTIVADTPDEDRADGERAAAGAMPVRGDAGEVRV